MQALQILIEEPQILKRLFVGFDISPFTNPNTKPLERLECLSAAADYILKLTDQLNMIAGQGNKKP